MPPVLPCVGGRLPAAANLRLDDPGPEAAVWQQVREAIRADVEPIADWPQEAEAWTGHELLRRYFTWAHRIPPAQPRAVHQAPGLQAEIDSLDAGHRRALDEIRADITAGRDLLRFLSDKVATFGTTSHQKTPLRHRDELDVMLFGWGIHHFHLSSRSKGGGSPFVRRSDELLLGMFTAENAYLLGVADHETAFNRFDLLERAVRAWPEAGLVPRMVGAVGLTQQPSAQEHTLLRDYGVTTVFEVNGIVYLPPQGGVTTAGTPMSATMAANRLMRPIDEVEEQGRLLFDQTDTTQTWVDASHLSVRGERGRLVVDTPVGPWLLWRQPPAEIVPK